MLRTDASFGHLKTGHRNSASPLIFGYSMRLVYLTDAQIPSRATNAMQVMRMCAAFARHGADVTLVHPHRFGNKPEGFDGDVFGFYGVPRSFRIRTLPTPLTLALSRRRRLSAVLRSFPAAVYLLWRSRPGADPFVAYGRSFGGAWLALRARRLWGRRSACRGVSIELHDAPRTARAWTVVERADRVFVISQALHDFMLTKNPALAGSLAIEHDCADDGGSASRGNDRAPVREALRLTDSVVVGYTGRVNVEKGAQTVLDAADLMASEGVSFLIVGKVYDLLGERADAMSNVRLVGFVPPSEVRRFVAAMDILVLPTSASIPYAAYTSPLKLFEYMTSGLPIVCADLPVLHEVVEHERDVLFFTPDDGNSLAAAIRRLREEPGLASRLASAAAARSRLYSWDARARRILQRLEVDN